MRYKYLHDKIRRRKNIMKGLYGKIICFSEVPTDALFIEAANKLYPNDWLFRKHDEKDGDAEILICANPPWYPPYPPTILFVPFPPKHPVKIMSPTHPICKFLFTVGSSFLRPPKEIEEEIKNELDEITIGKVP